MAESRENRGETRLSGTDSRTFAGGRGRRPLRSAEYLRKVGKKRAPASRQGEGTSADECRERKTERRCARSRANDRARERNKTGRERKRGRALRSSRTAEFYPKLGARDLLSLRLLPSSRQPQPFILYLSLVPSALTRPVPFPFRPRRASSSLLPRYNSLLPRDYREVRSRQRERASEREKARGMTLREKGRQKKMTVDESPC